MPSINWTIDYKPKSFSRAEFVLPEKDRKIFEEYAKGKRASHLLLTGDVGTGKTTAGHVLRKKAQSEYFIECAAYKQDKHWVENGYCWRQIFSSSLLLFTPAEKKSRPIKSFMLLDEVDELNTPNMLIGILDKAQEHGIILCMTSNFPNKIQEKIHSRCHRIHFGSGHYTWDNYSDDNPPGSRDDINAQLADLIMKITKKEAPKTDWNFPNQSFLKKEIIRKQTNLDIRKILITTQSYVHDGKFEPSEDELKQCQGS